MNASVARMVLDCVQSGGNWDEIDIKESVVPSLMVPGTNYSLFMRGNFNKN